MSHPLPALTCTLPLRTLSEANASQREHWGSKHRRHKHQRSETTIILLSTWGRLVSDWTTPITITLTRIAPRKLDSDNLLSALKHVRDGIADWLSVEDNDPLLTWVYAQRKGTPKEYAVEITIEH